MSQQPSVNQTPSVNEFTGWYNLGGDYGDGYPVLNSSADVPPYHHAELVELYCQFRDWFDGLLTYSPSVPFDPVEEPPFFVRSDADDRTLAVDADFRHLTVGMLRRIQIEFLSRFPLWRVILIAEVPSGSIVIYPTEIRFGDLPLGTDPEMALREVASINQSIKEARERPRRRHLQQMQRLLPEAIRTMGDQPFQVCGVLDNYEGDFNRLTICLLLRGVDRDACLVKGPPEAGQGFLSRGSRFGVDPTGSITSYIDVPRDSPFCLIPWILPANYRGQLWVVEPGTNRKHTLEITPDSITASIPQRT